MGRKKRPGFADISVTRASFDSNEARCPICRQTVGPGSGPRFVATFGGSKPSLATVTCDRCRTTVSIRFVEATTP